MSRQRGRALGRGLESLIPIGPGGGTERRDSGLPQFIDVDQVKPSPEQMRKQFPAEPLRELADSIRQHGVLQPILVRRLSDGYELIAGERRWRAARLAGVERIPAIVRHEAGAEDSLLLGLIENLQREDLDPIEEARGIKRLIDQFGLTHEEAAAKLGKHRVAVTQALRLLNACPAVISATAAAAISAGHARALVGLATPEAQEQGLKVVLGRHLSVRETERWVHDYKPVQPPKRRPTPMADPENAAVEDELADVTARLVERFGEAAKVTGTRSRGHVSLSYASPEELDDLVTFLLR
ncbi:MAG TPA: ParB/RepB/Spo0J family partition protein [Candidatus Dormibacteraeota bacterium]